MDYVRPKKHLGQHFLKDKSIARNIVDSLQGKGYEKVLEIGPGTGVLTDFLVSDKKYELFALEVDSESVFYLEERFTKQDLNLKEADFLKASLGGWLDGPYAVIGNFPYNISSQILFRVLDFKEEIPEVVGMFQKEVAERIASPPGNKAYGILSVLLQAYYDIEYLFTVSEDVFIPPPKVKSGVIRLTRNQVTYLGCDQKMFKQVVKTAFNQRRKKLSNALKPLIPKEKRLESDLLDLRAEQLSVHQFVELTLAIEKVNS